MEHNGFDVGIFDSRSDYHRQRDAKSYFTRVVEAYVDIRNMPPLTAISYDPAIKNHKLGATLIHYLADVEFATKKALGNNVALFAQWERLIHGESVPNSASIITRCARLYQARQLAPAAYFHVIKKGRPDRQKSVTVARGDAA